MAVTVAGRSERARRWPAPLAGALWALALRYAARQVPPEVLFAAWPAEPRLLARLIGQPAPAGG